MQLEDRMKGLAFIQVRAAREADGGLLDFSPSSLQELDRLIARDVTKAPLDPDILSEVIGAYLGETLVRRLGARWVEGEENVPKLELGGVRLDPLRRARLRIMEGPKRSLAAYFAAAQAAKERGDLRGALEDV